MIFIYKSCPNLHLNNTVVPFYLRNDSKFPIINNNLKSLTIFLTSGLSNRIRTLLGFFQVCKLKGLKLKVIWIQDETCNGYFLDYFQPIKGITFVNYKQDPIHYTGQSTIKNILKYYDVKQEKDLYCFLKLIPPIEKKLHNFIKNNNIINCIGIHVRRTDYTGNIIGKILNGNNSDKDFCNYIEKYSNNKNVFLATDNRDTQDFYIKKYGKKISFYTLIDKNNNLRKTSLENAILDIYTLSYCKTIKGTHNSSFSDFAKCLKKSRFYLNYNYMYDI